MIRISVLFLVGALIGCDQHSVTFDTQVAAVRAGTTDAIYVEDGLVDGRDLSVVEELAGLRTLVLDGGVIDDAGAQRLSSCGRIEHLRLRLSPISDRGMKHLAKMSGLQILNVPHGTFTEKGIRELAKLPNLFQLRLGSANAGRDVCQALRTLAGLRRLHLIGIPIDDEGLRELAAIPELESLYIDASEITDAGAEALFELRPDLHVHFNQKHHDLDPGKHPALH